MFTLLSQKEHYKKSEIKFLYYVVNRQKQISVQYTFFILNN